MAFLKRLKAREQKRYSRHVTKRRHKRPSIRPRQVVTVLLCGLAGVILALVLGNILQARSNTLHSGDGDKDWMQDASISPLLPSNAPDIRAVAISPEGNVGDILLAGQHGGVILPLCDGNGTPLYASAMGEEAGLPVAADAPSLSKDIARISGRNLNVTVVYTLSCFTASDAATAAYRRGLDLALLRECAEAAPDDILILGLPYGSNAADRQAMDFLTDLNALLTDLPERPSIGVALPPAAYERSSNADEETNQTLYAGNLSPARLRTVCDYLAMDLRSMSAEEIGILLPDIQYAYVRHSLRLLISSRDRNAVNAALDYGYERVFEME